MYDDPYEDWGISYDPAPAPEPAPEPAEYKAQGEFKPGEWTTRDWMANSVQSAGLVDTPLGEMFAGDYVTGGSAAARRLSDTNQDGMPKDLPKEEENVFSRIGSKLKTGVSDAFDKDPLKFLEAGLGGLAGLYKTKAARDAANAQAQSAVEVVKAKAAAEKDAQDRYNASFGTTKRAPLVKKPLTRMDGSAVYDANGRLKG